MNPPSIDIKDFLAKAEWMPVLDVRTPKEFDKGHISGALNLPLFSNEERARIGTLYAHTGSDAAILLGMDIVGPRLTEYIHQVRSIAPEKKLLLYCWRGGMRSNSLAWLFRTAGIECHTLNGGYKSYRNYILQTLNDPRQYYVIGGMTGSGKTYILKKLADMGEQILDLESLACHKGSAFGSIGQKEQPSQEQFENDLFHCWKKLDPEKPVWLEDESIQIGRLFIPRGFFDQFKNAPTFQIQLAKEIRVKRLVQEYTLCGKDALIPVFQRLNKRLGREAMQAAIDSLESGNFPKAAEIAIQYYDKVYLQGIKKKNASLLYSIDIFDEEYAEALKKMIDLIQKKNYYSIPNP